MSLRRTAFKPKAASRPAARDRSEEFASVVIEPAKARMAVLLDNQFLPLAEPPKHRGTGHPIRDSARGEQCLVRLPGVCTHDPATVIWSHGRWAACGRGKGIKAIDLAGAYACTACDAVFDGQRPPPEGMTREQVDLDWFHGHLRSLVRLREKGLIA